MPAVETRNVWNLAMKRAHVLEVVRLCRADPSMPMADALMRAQNIPEIPPDKRKPDMTWHLKKMQTQRVEGEIARQLAAKVAPEPPHSERSPDEVAEAERRRKEAEERDRAAEEERQREQESLAKTVATLREVCQQQADELNQVRQQLADALVAKPMLAFDALIDRLGASIGRALLPLQIPAAPAPAPQATAQAPQKAAPGGNGSGGNGEHPPAAAEHREEEDRDAAIHQQRYDAARGADASHPKAQPRPGLPDNCRKKKIVIVGLDAREQQQLSAEFAATVELRFLPSRCNTKRVSDLATQCDSIYTMNKVTPLDLVRAAAHGDHHQIQGGFGDLMKRLRERYRVQRHH